MKVRSPDMDFSAVSPHWAPCMEFAQRFNASSTVPAHIEPFLVKVMMRAKIELEKTPQTHTQLLEDVDIFIKQEVQHCKRHLDFNRQLYDKGYAGMQALEAPYNADYQHWLKDRSLRFLIAYSEGFEAMGSASAELFFTDIDDYLLDAEPGAVTLWKWHLAEEFEHREICFKVYQALYGKGIRSYFYRLYGFVYAIAHIGSHVKRTTAYLLEQDRRTWSASERSASLEREKAVNRRLAKASLPRLLKVFSPFYDPARKQVPTGMEQYLDL